jgi:hypothetical protein
MALHHDRLEPHDATLLDLREQLTHARLADMTDPAV